jgi:hypothetical protein
METIAGILLPAAGMERGALLDAALQAQATGVTQEIGAMPVIEVTQA